MCHLHGRTHVADLVAVHIDDADVIHGRVAVDRVVRMGCVGARDIDVAAGMCARIVDHPAAGEGIYHFPIGAGAELNDEQPASRNAAAITGATLRPSILVIPLI